MWANLIMLLITAPMSASANSDEWPVNPTSPILIESRNWPLAVRGHDIDSVRISGTEATVFADFSADGGKVFIEEADNPSTIDIAVPRQSQLTVTGALADLAIYDIIGDVNASNENNPISIRQIEGDVRAKSLMAAVDIRDVEGSVDAESNMAAVTMQRVHGRVRARSAMAGVSLKQSESNDVELHATHGVVTFVGGVYADGEVLLTSHRGPINVALAADSNVSVEISGERPLVQISGVMAEWDSDEVARFSVGQGLGRLVIESVSGPINVTLMPD
ncbi:MAG: hypothetical protein DHS20C11_11600 [Lysobacteraceae bacterium]|nr:MAG: hypothetical protein DHS20C11_11600 [Xanthomonadaceae bacterium]